MGSSENCSPTVSRCTFANNAAGSGGGLGLYGSGGSPTVTGCLFVGNVATNWGGGLQSNMESGAVVIANCVFRGNAAEEGGGIRIYAGKLTVVNCTFSENRANTNGGGISVRTAAASSNLTNCIFWGNSDAGGRDESAQINGGVPIVNYCCIEGLSGALGGTGNIGLDPMFRDVDGPDDIPGTQDDDLALAAGSPCIDAGDNSAVPAGIMSDANGMPRFFDDPGTADTGNGTPPIVDMGASEFQGESWPTNDTVPDYPIVDDFERYTDKMRAGEAIFQTWIDGIENNTGSAVGYWEAVGGTFGERIFVHGGTRSMPLGYDNVNSPYYSETQRTWTSFQDWTVDGLDTLMLHVRGQADNDFEPLYVALEDSAGRIAVVFHPDSAPVAASDWGVWYIPLSQFAGVNATAVTSLYIGLGDRSAPVPGGAGLIYVDDIWLTRR